MSVTWRDGTIEDYPGILRCHRDIEAKLGIEMDLPTFSDPSILSWVVAERNGQIVQFGTLEGLVEFRMGGCDREALQELIKTKGPELICETKAVGMRYIHVCVPPEVEKQVARKLKKLGITRSPNVLYSADLREQ